MHCTSDMGTTTISLSEEAYRILKAQKREGESFSDLVMRKFGKGNPVCHPHLPEGKRTKP